MSRSYAMACIAAMIVGCPWHAAEAQGGVKVAHPWVWETGRRWTAGDNKDVYMDVESDAGDRLIGASSPVADAVKLHQWVSTPGNVADRELSSIELPPGKWQQLAAGGTRVFIVGLKQALEAGSTFPLTLSFEKAGTIQVNVQVAVWNSRILDNTPLPPEPRRRR